MKRSQGSTFAKAMLHFGLGAAVSAAAAFAVLPTARSASLNLMQSLEDFNRLLDAAPVVFAEKEGAATKALMARMMAAHHRRDGEAEIAELAEDGYAWIRITDVGYQELASGRDVAAAATRNLYASDFIKDYMGVKAQPIAIAGNIGVQLEHESVRQPDGQVKTTSAVVVYEVRQGKLLRLWSFVPTSADH